MTIRLRTAFFIIIGLFALWFFYLERAILTPFILAGIFAYLINPIVNFFSDKIRLPRTLSVIIVYSILLTIVIVVGTVLTRQAISESSEFGNYRDSLIQTAKMQLDTLPDWMKPTVDETLLSLQKSKLFAPQSLFVLFPQTISRIVSFFIFLFSGFYFLKEGRTLFDKLLQFVPNDYKIEIEILSRRINAVLSSYLRGQLFMIFLVSLVLFIALSILGVRFALILAIFSGIAEIVPMIGPTVATSVAGLVVLVTGASHFSLLPMQTAMITVVIYVVVRQFQDYFVTPHVMRKITQLHPLVILFAALSGEHLGGILGVILAVPIAATLRILLEYSLDKINDQKQS